MGASKDKSQGKLKSVQEVKDLYASQFDPRKYCSQYGGTLDPDLEFFFENLHRTFSPGKLNSLNHLHLKCV